MKKDLTYTVVVVKNRTKSLGEKNFCFACGCFQGGGGGGGSDRALS